jgi:hypothetical protein
MSLDTHLSGVEQNAPWAMAPKLSLAVVGTRKRKTVLS